MLIIQTNKIKFKKSTVSRKCKLNALGELHKDMPHKNIRCEIIFGCKNYKIGVKFINIWNMVNMNTFNSVFKFLPPI